MEVTPKPRQSLTDIAIQTAGTVEAVVSLSIKNNIPLSENLPGEVLETVEPLDTIIHNRYQARNVCPATEVTLEQANLVPFGGIGFMGIEIDFIVG